VREHRDDELERQRQHRFAATMPAAQHPFQSAIRRNSCETRCDKFLDTTPTWGPWIAYLAPTLCHGRRGLYPIGTHSPTHAAHSSGLPL
jgi:hypothetical protein